MEPGSSPMRSPRNSMDRTESARGPCPAGADGGPRFRQARERNRLDPAGVPMDPARDPAGFETRLHGPMEASGARCGRPGIPWRGLELRWNRLDRPSWAARSCGALVGQEEGPDQRNADRGP